MKTIDLTKRLQPLVDRFAKTLADVLAKRVDATIAEVEVVVESAVMRLEEPAAPRVERKARKPRAQKPAAQAPEPPAPTKSVATSSSPSTSHVTPRKRAPVKCGKCGAVGYRKDGCGKTHNVSGDDSEDEPAAHPAPMLDDEPITPHVRIEDDRGKREFCDVHGWVGRDRFAAEQHELCEVREGAEECRACNGRGFRTSGSLGCKRCGGTGYEPEKVEAPEVAEEERPLAAAHVQLARKDGSPRARLRQAPRSKTIAVKKLTRAVMAEGEAELEDLGPPVDEPRPRTRAECVDAPRPCPFVSCKHHLYLDVDVETGSIKLNFPDVEPWELMESCSLDIADRGGLTLEDVGNLMNVTRERCRQLETRALLTLKRDGRRHGIDADTVDAFPHPVSNEDRAA